jgi:hypothetical protein
MPKTVLTREQVEAINHWLQNYVGGEEALLQAHLNKGEWVEETAALNGLPFMTLANALINGYEIEASPEEKIENWYRSLGHYPNGHYVEGVKEGIKKTLDILNIKLKGVNC